MSGVYVLVVVIAGFLAIALYSLRKRRIRQNYIRSYRFPLCAVDKVLQKHTQLSRADMELVSRGLQQFFLTYLNSNFKYVSMPSQVVDDLWHEFILDTRRYQEFSRQAFGRFFHHTPASAISKNKISNSGLRRCWQFACLEEKINPLAPASLPLLFTLDTRFEIVNGFQYLPDCSRFAQQSGGRAVYCGGDFADSSYDGGTDGLAESSTDGDAGGDGCGGGCGGGGD